MQDFRKLKVWEKAHALTLEVYEVTRSFPKDELFGLTSQMRRCASSIGSNLAEGCGRGGQAELARFASISMGSASELEYQLLLSKDLGLLKPQLHSKLEGNATEVKRMLSALISTLRRK